MKKGERITVSGRTGQINERQVLVAEQLRQDTKRAQQGRQQQRTSAQRS